MHMHVVHMADMLCIVGWGGVVASGLGWVGGGGAGSSLVVDAVHCIELAL